MYLTQGVGYRQLAAKYGVSRTTINKWGMIHQGIHNLPLTQKQVQYNSSAMNSSKVKNTEANLAKELQLPTHGRQSFKSGR